MKYKVLPGHSFRDSDGSVKQGGETIDLSEEAAAQHADKVRKLTAEEAAVEAEIEAAAAEAADFDNLNLGD